MKAVAKQLYKKYTAAKVLMECINGNWDSWRNNYSRLTITDIVWIHVCLHRFIPAQAHFDFRRVQEVLNIIFCEKKESVIISELGCWRGYLAKSLLTLFDQNKIFAYIGYDVDHYAIDTSVVGDFRYKAIKLTQWWHEMKTYGDVMLACHTIEHFTDTQLKQILTRCNMNNYRFLIWELPFCQDRNQRSWDGTNNTHMLMIDRRMFQTIVKSFGYDFFYSEKTSEGWMYGMEKRNLRDD